jgi:chromosome partitioning protein
MKTLVLANHKGGVGKSAVATLLAHYFAHNGQRVLALDFDHQGNFGNPLIRSGRVEVAAFTSDRLMTEGGQVVASPASTHPLALVPASVFLSGLDRQPTLHNTYATRLHAFLRAHDARFDVCLIDTHPNPDIRLVAALACADRVLSPLQLNQEALDGVHSLLNHPRAGVRPIKAHINPKLELLGLLPTLVESNPFQKANFAQVVRLYRQLLIPLGPEPGHIAFIPRRAIFAEAQAEGAVLWEMKKTAARDTWKEIEAGIRLIANIMTEAGRAS